MEAIDRASFAALCRSDPRAAGTMLWKAFYRKLAVFCAQFDLPPDAEPEDLAQEALLRAMERAWRYDPAWSVATWVYAIARNLCLSASRRNRGTRAAFDPDRAPSAHEGPEEAAMRAADADLVAGFLRGLPAGDRALAFLRTAEGMGFAEASRALGRPAGTLKWRMSEIRRALAKEWEDAYGG